MAGISKRTSGAWQNTSYGIRATATNTITTLPTTIYGDGTTATIALKGNTVQNGTPTPGNPIMPQGCGELESGQYKIPISSAGQTTQIYLGEVQTTRKIKKLVFDGTEDWSSSYGSFRLTLNEYLRERGWIPFCSHYKGIDFVSGGDALQNGETAFLLTNSGNNYLYVCDTSISTVADFKAYLASQYAAGTPVRIWYVLATEITGIVNEPLMKIGDYADEVNGISIPTTDGANTLSVDTTVKPSEVNVNYHGWHMGTVHERVSDDWD